MFHLSVSVAGSYMVSATTVLLRYAIERTSILLRFFLSLCTISTAIAALPFKANILVLNTKVLPFQNKAGVYEPGETTPRRNDLRGKRNL